MSDSTVGTHRPSILAFLRSHAGDRQALTILETGHSVTFGKLDQHTTRLACALRQRKLTSGDTVLYRTKPDLSSVPLLLACWEVGLRLQLAPLDRAAPSAPRPELVITPTPHASDRHLSCVSLDDLYDSAAGHNPADQLNPAAAIGVGTHATAIGTAFLLQSVRNLRAAYPVSAADAVFSASGPLALESLVASVILPLSAGMHVLHADDPAALWTSGRSATLAALSAGQIRTLLRSGKARRAPDRLRFVLCSCGRLSPAEIADAEQTFGRRVHQGYGTPGSGFWSAFSPHDAPSAALRPRPGVAFGIRTLRSPLDLLSALPASSPGEIVVDMEQAMAGHEQKTGDIGWLTADGSLVVLGGLIDIAVRAGRAILLPEVDAVLGQHDAVRASHTFRERGERPTERVIAACATAEDPASLHAWLASRVAPQFLPDQIISLADLPPGGALERVATLRDIASGVASRAVAAALTARRFRRNPAYDEPGLHHLIQTALLQAKPLEFLMFWGCGPRAAAETPDHMAIAALRDLLEAVAAAAPLQARAHIVFTDIHATNNGHSAAHYGNYFAGIRQSAAGLNVTAELESAVWARGGLTRSAISDYEQTPAFLARWSQFALRDRFLHQASRHSRMTDKEAAARHYYATCLLERTVLKTLFAGSAFLTYNGPEFNECFPDLPTLYVYPGPRGRNDKPWFVQADEIVLTQEAAE